MAQFFEGLMDRGRFGAVTRSLVDLALARSKVKAFVSVITVRRAGWLPLVEPYPPSARAGGAGGTQ